MKLKLIAIIAVAAISVLARAQQSGPVPKPTKADAQNVVQIITSDKMKTQAYCDLTKLEGQVKAAAEKKDTKTLEALSTQADALIDLSSVGKRCRPRAKMRRDGSRRTSPSCRSY
jgi:hypothetical protein